MSAHVMFLGVQRTGFIEYDQNEIYRDQRGAVKNRAAIPNLRHSRLKRGEDYYAPSTRWIYRG